MTENSKLYAFFCVVWSVIFFAILHWALFDSASRWLYILGAAISYGLGFGIVGAWLGRSDSARDSKHDLSRLYSLISNAASFLVGGLWILIWRGQHWWELLTALIFLAISTTIIFLASRGRIKGIDKDKLFQ